jgi:hypothetical protein
LFEKLTLIKNIEHFATGKAAKLAWRKIKFRPCFHRGATRIQEGLSDKLLRVHFVFAGRKKQALAYGLKVSTQSEWFSLATINASSKTE